MIQSENFEFPEPISDLNVLVIGAGLMGHSIAGVFAGAGASVTVHDVDPRALEAVPEKLGKQLVTVGADPALIEAGHLGAKTGSGLLQWDSNARAAAAERLEQHLLKPVSGPS